jgi:cytochrome P450
VKLIPCVRVTLFAFGAHHYPNFWAVPEEFQPERWMAGNGKKQVKYSYSPFGGGKRSCIGGAMSQVENTLALSLLLRRFRPEYVGSDPARLNATVTLTPKGGLPFKIRELN